jgi:hypothetical protein
MNTGTKVILYTILVIATTVTGYFFFKNFGKLFEEKPAKVETTETAAATNPDATATAGTNEVAVVDTNAVPVTTNPPPETNIITGEVLSNSVPQTNVVAAVETPPTPPVAPKPATPPKQEKSRIGLWTGSFIMCIIALGGFIAWDVSNFLGNKSLRVLYNDDLVGMKDAAYDEAEKTWANGQPLEAIRMMRDYLNKNPREVHVSLRIAEIYEKDLNNHLAAALEYEEVLKKKLPDERWGWAAIHLCNLYFKLGQEVKGFALLQRIVKDYGETQAADKARKRLSEVDPGLLAEAEPPTAAETPAPAPATEAPKSNLPPGFRPKK